ncbi:hypothetical protein ACN28S_48535 [Cystobacter fuscus]
MTAPAPASPFGDRTVHPASAAALDYDIGTALKGGADAVGGGAVLRGASPPVVAGATAFASGMAVGEAIAPAVFGGSGKGVQMVTDCSPNCGQLQYRFGGIVIALLPFADLYRNPPFRIDGPTGLVRLDVQGAIAGGGRNWQVQLNGVQENGGGGRRPRPARAERAPHAADAVAGTRVVTPARGAATKA